MAHATARTRTPLPARSCLHCGNEYIPNAGPQKWCKNCVWDAASRYRVVRYGAAGVEQYRDDLANGRRTSTCRTCGDEFSYHYFGGSDRKFCDTHASGRVVAERAEFSTRHRPCAACGLPAELLDDDGRCFRHLPRGHQVDQTCEICGGTFLTLMKRPVRVCSRACTKARRRPMSELRACELCSDSYYPTHPQQKFCKTCVTGRGARHRATRYRMSAADVEALSAKFDGLCWICREKPGRCVDHDHSTGLVRGWLCLPCNGALHYLERPGWVADARAYLNETAAAGSGSN